MKSYLRRDTVEIKSLGQKIHITELSAGSFTEVKRIQASECADSIQKAAATIANLCVKEFVNEDVETLLESLSVGQLTDISNAVYALSNLYEADEAGNSEAGSTGDSN